MCSLAGDGMRRHEGFPFRINAPFIQKERKHRSDRIHLCQGLLHAETQAIPINRSRGDDPKLIKILRNDEDFVILLDQVPYGVASQLKLWMLRLRGSKKNVGIEQDSHSPRPA